MAQRSVSVAAAWLCMIAGAAAFRPAGLPFISSQRSSAMLSSLDELVMMAGMPMPSGSLVALVTPMLNSGAVDIPKLRELLQWHKEEGTDGVVILGTTGEASTLTDTEKGEVMAVAREELGGKLPIVIGTGTISTESTIAATKQAKLFGADAALIVTPYYVKPSQEGLICHFTTIADAVDLPIILYNVPGRTGVDMNVETTISLSRHPMIIGLKDATGDNARVSTMRAVLGSDFRLYSGEDAMARDYVLQGGDGVISVTANVAPRAVHQVMTAAKAGDAVVAAAADDPLGALHRDLFVEANPIPVKWALHRMGRIGGGIRSPLSVLDPTYHSRLEGALQQGCCIDKPKGDESCPADHARWPNRQVLLQGHLFDAGLINQALELIEKRGGDFEITNFNVAPNDKNSEFNFKRTSSVSIKLMAVDGSALDDITEKLKQLVDVLPSAEGSLTVVPSPEL